MSDVTLSIGGRNYTVACANGEEAHVAELGLLMDEKLGQLGGNLSPQEAQNLLFAGLFIADDLHETRKQVAAVLDAKADAEGQLVEQQREANLALGMRDELQLRIVQLESELDGLQSAQQRRDAEVDDIRRELGLRREQANEATQASAALGAQIAQLQRDLEATMSANDSLAAEKVALAAKVDRLGSMTAVVASGAGTGSPLDLAPALERFAHLLEECAEKLESKAQAT